MRTHVYSAADLKIETKDEIFSYPKGSMIQLEVGKSQDVYVVHHRLFEYDKKPGDACAKAGKSGTLQSKTGNDGKTKLVCVVPGMESYSNEDSYEYTPKLGVKPTFLKFLRLEDLKFFLDSALLGTQISEHIDFKDFKLESALLDEKLSPSLISRYMSSVSSPVQKLFTKDNVSYIRVPVFNRSKVMLTNEKLKVIQEFDAIEDREIESDGILAVSSRTKGNANETGYFVATELMAHGVDSKLEQYLVNKLKTSLPDNWEMQEDDGRILVAPNGDRPAAFLTLLNSLPVDLEVNRRVAKGREIYEISIKDKEQEEVVESYYSRDVITNRYELVEQGNGKDNGKTPEEGDECRSEGKKGVLQKQGDALVCVVKESFEPDFSEDINEGDACMDNSGNVGVIKLTEDNRYCCVVTKKVMKKVKNEDSAPEDDEEDEEADYQQEIAFKIPNKKYIEGEVRAAYENAIKRGLSHEDAVNFVSDNQFKGILKREADARLGNVKEDEEGSSHGGPVPGDPCEAQGQTGTLQLVNGALICALGGVPPVGTDGAN